MKTVTSSPSRIPIIGFAIQMFGVSTLFILSIQLLRSGDKSESWDKGAFALSAILGLVFMLRFLQKRFSSGSNVILSICASSIFVLGILGVERHDRINGVDLSPILWLGFGPGVLIALAALIPSIFSIYRWEGLPRWIRYSLSALAGLITMGLIPAAWQGGASIIDTYHSEYVINENLAVSAGHLPYVDFIPQYCTLFSWLIAPFKSMLTPDGLVTLSLYLMSTAAIAAVLIGVYLVYKGTNKRSLTLSILLVIPFTSIAQFPGRDVFSGTIYSLLSQLPIRLLPTLLISLLLISMLSKKKDHMAILSMIGLFSGFSIWLNQDFAFIGGFLALSFLFVFQNSMKSKLTALGSYGLGFSLYPVLMRAFGEQVNLSFVGFFVTQYQNGLMAEPIITPGPVLIILPLIATVAAISTGLLLRERFSTYQIPDHLRIAVLTASFFSLWSAAGFAYYLNRSYASGQMQILFLPLSVALANFIYFILELDGDSKWSARSFFKAETWRKTRLKNSLVSLTLAIAMALPLASTVAFPQPNIELKRLTQGVPGHTWPKKEHAQFRTEVNKMVSSEEDMYYFGTSGNYYELSLGLRSLNVFNSPFDLTISELIVEQACFKIRDSGATQIILNDEGIAIAQAFSEKSLCGVYSENSDRGPRFLVRR